jgi:signal peptidase II
LKQRGRESLILPIVTALILLADQITKRLVTARLQEGQSMDLTPWLTPIFRITHVTNTGVAFGLFPQGSYFFIGVAVVVIAAIIMYYRHLPDGQWLMRIALGLQLGGASGNLLDRLRHQGRVVDFIDLNFWPMHHWPVSNIADISIVSGVILLTILMLWEERQLAQEGQQESAEYG